MVRRRWLDWLQGGQSDGCTDLSCRGGLTRFPQDCHLHRPDYSDSLLSASLGLLGLPVDSIKFADIGAGTGILTRMVAERDEGLYSMIAAHPNEDTLGVEKAGVEGNKIVCREGSEVDVGLSSSSVDSLTMTSSCHGKDTEVALCEFHSVLRPHEWLTAAWNPRRIAGNPLLGVVEAKTYALKPDLG